MEPILLPHPSATALHTLVIYLGAARNGTPPSFCGRAIHTQVLKWFQLGQPEISQAIHDSQESPISLSGLLSKHPRNTVREGDEFYIRIGLLNGNLLDSLLRGLEQWGMRPVVLSQFPFTIKSINMLPGSDHLVSVSDYSLLAQVPWNTDTLTLSFLSPTSFKVNQGHHIQPIPLPSSVFGNLERRWNVFAPKELRLPKTHWGGLIYDFNISARTLRMGDVEELGAVGWVRYRFPDAKQAKIAANLSHFACFAGVGRKTAMGLGQTLFQEANRCSIYTEDGFDKLK